MSQSAIPTSIVRQTTGSRAIAVDRTGFLGAVLLVAVIALPHFPLREASIENTLGLDFQLFARLTLCGACGLYGLKHLRQTAKYLRMFPMAWGLIFAVWCLATLPLAIDLRVATAGCTVLCCILLFAPAILLRIGKDRVLWAVLAGSLIYLCGQWALYLSGSPLGYGVEPLPDGGFVTRLGADSQQLGFESTAMIGVAMVLCSRGRISRPLLFLIVGIAVATLLGAKSRTAAVAATSATMLILLRSLSVRSLVVWGSLAIAGVCAIFIAVGTGAFTLRTDVAAESIARTGSTDEIYRVTGRTDIWPVAWNKFLQSPVIGYGYVCTMPACKNDYVDDDGFPMRHAHDEILNVMVCTGFFGGLILLFMYTQQIHAAWTRPDAFVDYVTIATIVAGITEPVLFTSMPTALTILWFLALCWRHVDGPCDVVSNSPLGVEST